MVSKLYNALIQGQDVELKIVDAKFVEGVQRSAAQ